MRLTRTTKVVLAATSIAAMATATALLARSRLTWKQPTEIVRIAKETSQHYRKVPMVRTDDHAALIEAFDSAETVSANGETLTETQRDALIDTVVDIIELRAQADGRAYAQWMQSRGSILKTIDQIGVSRLRRFQSQTGNVATPNDSLLDIFKISFEAELLHSPSGATRPAGIAVDPDAIQIQIAKIRDPDSFYKAYDPILIKEMQSYPLPENISELQWSPAMGKLHWYLGDVYGGVSHWAAPVSYTEVVRRDGEALVARALFVLRTKNGDAIPTTALFYFDNGSQIWHLENMSYVNTFAVKGGPEF